MCEKAFLFLLKPLAYCILDVFIRTEVLAPEIFLQFGEQVEMARSKIWAVDWMWQHCKLQKCNGISCVSTCVMPGIVLLKQDSIGFYPLSCSTFFEIFLVF